MRTALFGLAIAALAAACGGNEMPPDSPVSFAGGEVAPEASAAPLPPNTLRRSDVLDAVARGPADFLRRVELDDRPVFYAGQFHGFRIARLRDREFWRGIDLRPGDVVTRVNGIVVQHPEDASAALQSLEVSSELVVDFDREGQPQELKFTILDDVARPAAPPPSASAPASAAPAPPSAPPAPSSRTGTGR